MQARWTTIAGLTLFQLFFIPCNAWPVPVNRSDAAYEKYAAGDWRGAEELLSSCKQDESDIVASTGAMLCEKLMAFHAGARGNTANLLYHLNRYLNLIQGSSEDLSENLRIDRSREKEIVAVTLILALFYRNHGQVEKARALLSNSHGALKFLSSPRPEANRISGEVHPDSFSLVLPVPFYPLYCQGADLARAPHRDLVFYFRDADSIRILWNYTPTPDEMLYWNLFFFPDRRNEILDLPGVKQYLSRISSSPLTQILMDPSNVTHYQACDKELQDPGKPERGAVESYHPESQVSRVLVRDFRLKLRRFQLKQSGRSASLAYSTGVSLLDEGADLMALHAFRKALHNAGFGVESSLEHKQLLAFIQVFARLEEVYRKLNRDSDAIAMQTIHARLQQCMATEECRDRQKSGKLIFRAASGFPHNRESLVYLIHYAAISKDHESEVRYGSILEKRDELFDTAERLTLYKDYP